MTIQNDIQQCLDSVFDTHHLTLENESYKHNVPAGSESHFKLVLVSDDFAAKRLVQRHQLVYKALAEQMTKIHALAMHLYTKDEWAEREGSAPLSPDCHGGERN